MAPVTLPTGRPAARDRDPSLRRRRPFRRRPAYDYYDDEYYDEEYSRPRGYGREEYEYDDWKYRRDRERDFRDRDRDFRDRDTGRSRDTTDRDVRERYPARNNRRDPPRVRDPPEEDLRIRTRDPEQGSRFPASREVDDVDMDDRRTDSKNRDTEDRRYSDKRYRDDYEEKDSAPAVGSSASNAEGLVKPAAPVSSVYSRPRTPPKIRRPVPLSEQDRYAYKATAAQSTEEPRRRPVEAQEDDYYEDELEEVRPIRRPLRRRPSYRDRDRDFYDQRDRDRPYRPRYRDDEDDARPRKHPDRSRDRYYDRERERGRDRSLDRGKDRAPERSLDRDRGRTQQDADRQERPYSSRPLDRERDLERSRPPSRSKDTIESTDILRRPATYDRTSERTPSTGTTTSTTTTCLPEQFMHKSEIDTKEIVTERSERPIRPGQSSRLSLDDHDSHADIVEKSQRPQHSDYQDRDHDEKHHAAPALTEEYSSEYYDEPEDPPAPPPRTTVRIVKRPFLPSRGGNPNPRGLLPVGYKAMMTSRKEEEKERSSPQDTSKSYYDHDNPEDSHKRHHQDTKARTEEKQPYDAYKSVQVEAQTKQRTEDYDTTISRPMIRRPSDRQRDEETTSQQLRSSENHEDVSQSKWTEDEYDNGNHNVEHQSSNSGSRNKGRIVENQNSYSTTYRNEENQEQPTGPGNYRAKQKLNEVTHRLQDIPESEYDVTLNEALTPSVNQEANLPSGFVLPVHRQLNRDTVLQPSENNYKISRPVASQQQPQPIQQQKPFVPSPQFVPAGVSNNERLRTVFYRTPESIQISGPQYRQHRGPWHDYTGY